MGNNETLLKTTKERRMTAPPEQPDSTQRRFLQVGSTQMADDTP